MRSIIYLRSSTEKQEPEIQLKDIRTISPKPGPGIMLVEQQSGWKENAARPEFERLKRYVIEQEIECIYVWNLDRIYRNRKRLLEFLTLCKAKGVTVYSYHQRWLQSINQMPSPWNEMIFDLMLQIIGWMAEDESRTKSERVRMAVRKTKKGTISYKGNRWGRKPLPKQAERRVLKLHQQGQSLRAIAKAVMVYDKQKNGKPISKSAVHKIIAANSG